jgi:hypothetical protein
VVAVAVAVTCAVAVRVRVSIRVGVRVNHIHGCSLWHVVPISPQCEPDIIPPKVAKAAQRLHARVHSDVVL